MTTTQQHVVTKADATYACVA